MFNANFKNLVTLKIISMMFTFNVFAVSQTDSSSNLNSKFHSNQGYVWGYSSIHQKAFVEMKRKKILVMFENKVIDDGSLVELYNQVKDKKVE